MKIIKEELSCFLNLYKSPSEFIKHIKQMKQVNKSILGLLIGLSLMSALLDQPIISLGKGGYLFFSIIGYMLLVQIISRLAEGKMSWLLSFNFSLAIHLFHMVSYLLFRNSLLEAIAYYITRFYTIYIQARMIISTPEIDAKLAIDLIMIEISVLFFWLVSYGLKLCMVYGSYMEKRIFI